MPKACVENLFARHSRIEDDTVSSGDKLVESGQIHLAARPLWVDDHRAQRRHGAIAVGRQESLR
jgi:hypothetical protein